MPILPYLLLITIYNNILLFSIIFNDRLRTLRNCHVNLFGYQLPIGASQFPRIKLFRHGENLDYDIDIKYGSVGFRKEVLPSIRQHLNKKNKINLDRNYTTVRIELKLFWDINYELEMDEL